MRMRKWRDSWRNHAWLISLSPTCWRRVARGGLGRSRLSTKFDPCWPQVCLVSVCNLLCYYNVYMNDADVVRCSNGKKLTKANILLGYILAEYIEGDNAEPTRSDCVDRYIMNALQKHHAFNLKITPTSTVAVLA